MRKLSADVTAGVTRTDAQFSWHDSWLLHDAGRRTLGVKKPFRPLVELPGPFRLKNVDDLVVTGVAGRHQRQARIATTVLELRNPSERRYIAIQTDRVEHLEAGLAELNAALGFDEAGATAAIDAAPEPDTHRPGRWKAVLIKKRQELAKAAITFHTRNRLRSTAYPWTSFGLAMANLAIAVVMTLLGNRSEPSHSRLDLFATALSGLLRGLSFWPIAAVVVYLHRAFYVRPEKRAAAEAQLTALTTPSATPR